MMKSIKRYVYIDIAKGIGMVLVILSHTQGFYKGGYYFTAFYMQLFFVLSGYLFVQCDYNIQKELMRRCRRLLLPYFAYNLLLVGIFCPMYFYSTPPPLYNYTIQTIEVYVFKAISGILYSRYDWMIPINFDEPLLFIGNGPTWFLSCMFISSMFFYLTMRNQHRIVSIIICIVAVSLLLNCSPILLPWSIDTAFLGCLFMICGWYLKKYEFECVSLRVCIVLTGVYYILCKYNPGINMSIRLYGEHGTLSVFLFIAIGIIGSIIFIRFCKYIEETFVGKIFSIIGKHTISILCLHYILWLYINAIISIPDTHRGIVGWTMYYCVIGIIIVICILFDFLVHKIRS